jgi:transcription-repair coupling factor (superfamily II helicase)
MNYILKDFVSTKVYENLKGLEKEYFQANNKKYRYPVVLSGLVGVSKAMLGSALNIDNKEKVVIVTYNELQARDLLKNILYFTEDVDFFPKREISIYDYDAESNEIEFDRIAVLNKIHKK